MLLFCTLLCLAALAGPPSALLAPGTTAEQAREALRAVGLDEPPPALLPVTSLLPENPRQPLGIDGVERCAGEPVGAETYREALVALAEGRSHVEGVSSLRLCLVEPVKPAAWAQPDYLRWRRVEDAAGPEAQAALHAFAALTPPEAEHLSISSPSRRAQFYRAALELREVAPARLTLAGFPRGELSAWVDGRPLPTDEPVPLVPGRHYVQLPGEEGGLTTLAVDLRSGQEGLIWWPDAARTEDPARRRERLAALMRCAPGAPRDLVDGDTVFRLAEGRLSPLLPVVEPLSARPVRLRSLGLGLAAAGALTAAVGGLDLALHHRDFHGKIAMDPSTASELTAEEASERTWRRLLAPVVVGGTCVSLGAGAFGLSYTWPEKGP